MKPTYVLLTIVLAAGIMAALVFWFFPASFQSANQAMTLTAPPGFQVERAAGPPLVDRPIVATSTSRDICTSLNLPGPTTRLKNSYSKNRTESCVSRTRTATAGSTRKPFLPTG